MITGQNSVSSCKVIHIFEQIGWYWANFGANDWENVKIIYIFPFYFFLVLSFLLFVSHLKHTQQYLLSHKIITPSGTRNHKWTPVKSNEVPKQLSPNILCSNDVLYLIMLNQRKIWQGNFFDTWSIWFNSSSNSHFSGHIVQNTLFMREYYPKKL